MLFSKQQLFEHLQHHHAIHHPADPTPSAEKEMELVHVIAMMDLKATLTTKKEVAEGNVKRAVIAMINLLVSETSVLILALALVEVMQFVKFNSTFHAAHVLQDIQEIHSHNVVKSLEQHHL